ncbi:MAG: hypothetical protein DWQ10_18480 [Calditrichaeota bacterium]|nr:MAG: hypothetical protein DWQ10_18480 [Calditrichota bacterium]
MNRIQDFILALAIFSSPLLLMAQSTYPWPVTPLNESQEISGTFCEYRDTAPSPHFHNGVDIPKTDGSPVYAVSDAVITAIDPNGSSAYVRAGRFAYVHIAPSPALEVGDSVYAETTVLGTILPGLGHVHLNDGYPGAYINAIRPGGGLTPFIDPWPPILSNVRFYLLDTETQLAAGKLSGQVRITFRVQERNGPAGASASRLNNGAYWAGYKILSRDRLQVIYSPTTDGIQYKFDNKPDNTYVHNVFDENQSTLSNHVYNITSRIENKTYWDTEAFPEGDYTVMLFAGDTRDNADTIYVDVTTTRLDLIPPAQPILLSAIFENDSLQFTWSGHAEADLAGYRLHASTNNAVWNLDADENEIQGDAGSYKTALQDSSIRYFYLTAVDTAAPANESMQSDIYATRIDPASRKILIVDGFDRTQSSGSYHESWHPFAATHARAISANGFGCETCTNESVSNGDVRLTDYDAVFWVLGDESTTDQTFSTTEQTRVREFLTNGGYLFVSGSEIGWDLGEKGTTTDKNFLRDYLKIGYESDDSNSYSVKGETGTPFQGLTMSYGTSTSPYPEDYPDTFILTGGSQSVLRYSNNKIAAAYYEGVFGNGTEPGKIFVMAFPFETITTSSNQNILMRRVLDSFFPSSTAVAISENGLPGEFRLSQNYPNPFLLQTNTGITRKTQIEFSVAQPSVVQFRIYDILGRTVKKWQDQTKMPGIYHLAWDGRNKFGNQVATGIYFWEMTARASKNTNNILQRNSIKILVR